MNTTPRKFYAADLPASGQPGKKMTPMAKLIDRIKPLIGKYGIEADAVIITVIEEATSLLEAEREMVGKARVTAPLLVTSENDVYEEEANDYFTQNYQQ